MLCFTGNVSRQISISRLVVVSVFFALCLFFSLAIDRTKFTKSIVLGIARQFIVLMFIALLCPGTANLLVLLVATLGRISLHSVFLYLIIEVSFPCTRDSDTGKRMQILSCHRPWCVK